MITRQEAIGLYGSAVELASALGYASRHAVYMWPKSGPIPESAYLKLRYQLKPEWFDSDGALRAPVAPSRAKSSAGVHAPNGAN